MSNNENDNVTNNLDITNNEERFENFFDEIENIKTYKTKEKVDNDKINIILNKTRKSTKKIKIQKQ